jgi:hypothetical protein
MWFLLLCGALASLLCPRSYSPVEYSAGGVGCDPSCQKWQGGERILNHPRTGFLVVRLMPSDCNESAGIAFSGVHPSRNVRGAYLPPPQSPIDNDASPCWDTAQKTLPRVFSQNWSLTSSENTQAVQSHDLYHTTYPKQKQYPKPNPQHETAHSYIVSRAVPAGCGYARFILMGLFVVGLGLFVGGVLSGGGPVIHGWWKCSYVWEHGCLFGFFCAEPGQEVGAHFRSVPCDEARVVPVQPCGAICDGVEATVYGRSLVCCWDVRDCMVCGWCVVFCGGCYVYDVVGLPHFWSYVVGFAWGVGAV